MSNSFETFIAEELRHLRDVIESVDRNVRDMNIKLLDHVPKASCEVKGKINDEYHKSLVGWIMGAYTFIIGIVVAIFIKN